MYTLDSEFKIFIKDISERLAKLGLSFNSFPLDHICYRVSTKEEYLELKEYFITQSVLYTEKHFHDRQFHTFVLKKPLMYSNVTFHYLEFAEPGGSDDYKTGFQHFEFLTNKKWEDIVLPEVIKKFLFTSKHGEPYIKYEDKIAIKLTNTQQITHALLEDNSQIFLVTNTEA